MHPAESEFSFIDTFTSPFTQPNNLSAVHHCFSVYVTCTVFAPTGSVP